MPQVQAWASRPSIYSRLCQAEYGFIAKSFKVRNNYIWSGNTKLLVDDPDGLVDGKEGALVPIFDEPWSVIDGTKMFPIFDNLEIIQNLLTYQRMTLLSPVALSSSKTGKTFSNLNFFFEMSWISFWTALKSSVPNLWRNLPAYLDNDNTAYLILQKVLDILKHPHYPSPLRIGDIFIHFRQI